MQHILQIRPEAVCMFLTQSYWLEVFMYGFILGFYFSDALPVFLQVP